MAGVADGARDRHWAVCGLKALPTQAVVSHTAPSACVIVTDCADPPIRCCFFDHASRPAVLVAEGTASFVRVDDGAKAEGSQRPAVHVPLPQTVRTDEAATKLGAIVVPSSVAPDPYRLSLLEAVQPPEIFAARVI